MSTMALIMDKNTFTVGIIGMGDMGKMYARRLSDAGWRYLSPLLTFLLSQNCHFVSTNILHSLPLPSNDDLSAFGSTYRPLQAQPPFWHWVSAVDFR